MPTPLSTGNGKGLASAVATVRGEARGSQFDLARAPGSACTQPGGHPFIRVAASFSACWVLLLRFRGSRLDGVLLGPESLRVVLFLGFFLVDDHCEELLHLLGHAGR